MKESRRLLINLLVAFILIGSAATTYYFIFVKKENKLTIEKTPMFIESIQSILEISTVSYKDQVVVDSVEFYTTDYSFYDVQKYFDLYNHGVKRRLTLIVTGEIKYGVDLKKNTYQFVASDDSIVLKIPSPEMLDIIVLPSKTEVYKETGEWTDKERHILESKAKQKFIETSQNLNLEEKSRENIRQLFEKLVNDKRKLVLEFI